MPRPAVSSLLVRTRTVTLTQFWSAHLIILWWDMSTLLPLHLLGKSCDPCRSSSRSLSSCTAYTVSRNSCTHGIPSSCNSNIPLWRRIMTQFCTICLFITDIFIYLSISSFYQTKRVTRSVHTKNICSDKCRAQVQDDLQETSVQFGNILSEAWTSLSSFGLETTVMASTP